MIHGEFVGNAYDEEGPAVVPTTFEAIQAFEQGVFVKETLGEDVHQHTYTFIARNNCI